MAGIFIGVGCAGADRARVDILAASSYTDVAEPLEALLEEEPGVDVEFSFGSSGSFLEPVSYTHFRAHDTVLVFLCCLLLANHNNILHHTYFLFFFPPYFNLFFTSTF